MDANMQQPKVKKDSKKKIRVEFERTPLKDRLKAKFLNLFFFQKVAWFIFRLALLVGISYVVLYPFLTKIAGSFMGRNDFVDVTVRLIPKNFTLDTYKAILFDMKTEDGGSLYFSAFGNTLLIALGCAILQTFVCCLIAYGLAKFRFRGNKMIFALVILTMIVPHKTLQLSLFMGFRYFDIFGVLSILSGGSAVDIAGFEALNDAMTHLSLLEMEDHAIRMTNTYLPLFVLSATGLAFKNGLYIFMLRQFFSGVPDALEESAYIDGSGVFRTFFTIILPLSVPMMITVFLFSFCWQWVDNFYVKLFISTKGIKLMPDVVAIPSTLDTEYAGQNLYESAIKNTCGICIIMPLVILYAFCQNFLVQGIERSGLTAE